MIKIEITGPSGEGKTTTAIAIMRLLRDLKQDVKVQCARHTRTSVDVYSLHTLKEQAKEFSTKRKFLIVDMFDAEAPETASAVRH